MSSPMGAAAPNAVFERRRENLALVFQDVLTVIERMRSRRQQVSDAGAFRAQIREALKAADAEARKRGYTADDIQLATFAVVAYLDESVQSLQDPVFGDWPRKPLQEEMFGNLLAGEIFFKHLQQIMGRNDSHETADLLEVYYLCMLLGFSGRYSTGGRGDLKAIMDKVAEKIHRIRSTNAELSPSWRLPNDVIVAAPQDAWVKRLMMLAIACFVLTALLYIFYQFSLSGGVGELRQMTAGRS